ncbi:hypothetical protein CJ430_31175, partial [Klebsiella pneumoniae]
MAIPQDAATLPNAWLQALTQLDLAPSGRLRAGASRFTSGAQSAVAIPQDAATLPNAWLQALTQLDLAPSGR